MQEQKKSNKLRRSVIMRIATLLVPIAVLVVLLSQTVFAQNTYVITDGERVVIHTSSATDPATILNEAGLSLGEDDTYTTSPGFGVSEITVRRSGSTGTSAAKGYITGEQTYTVGIPCGTKRVNDPNLPAGSEKVLIEGREGQMRCVAEVTYLDGTEVSRKLKSETIIEQPVDELIAVGTGPSLEAELGQTIIGDGYIILPTGETLSYSHTMQVLGTAYTHTDPGCDMYTSTLTRVDIGTVAVDPRLIPYGTRMFIVSNDGQYIYGVSTALDCGGAIIDKRIDLYYPTPAECYAFGRRNCTIYFLTGEGN